MRKLCLVITSDFAIFYLFLIIYLLHQKAAMYNAHTLYRYSEDSTVNIREIKTDTNQCTVLTKSCSFQLEHLILKTALDVKCQVPYLVAMLSYYSGIFELAN